LKELHQEYL